MKYAIIAAGEGSRLSAEGISTPKPLVELQGVALIDRLMGTFLRHHAEEIVVICNEQSPGVVQHLNHIARNGLNGCRVPLRVVVKTTPSSMHSFYEMAPYLEGGPFVLTTVDTVFDHAWFGRFVKLFAEDTTADGYMVVTPFEDDEKPLYVSTNENLIITGFFDSHPCTPAPSHPRTFVSGGIYALKANAIPVLRQCVERGEMRMRNFQRALVQEGLQLKAWVAPKVMDIDHAADIVKAEAFLAAPRVHLAHRRTPAPTYLPTPAPSHPLSPDDAILHTVAEKLCQMGFEMGCTNLEETDINDFERDYCNGRILRNHVVLCMQRDNKFLQQLQRLQQMGMRVVNSVESIANCSRGKLHELMHEHHFVLPPSNNDKGWWVKRADVHSLGSDDVVYCATAEQRDAAISRFTEKSGVPPVVSAHVEGTEVKFYGVGEWFRPPLTPPREGEQRPPLTPPRGGEWEWELEWGKLRDEARRLARITGLTVWGGDAILTPEPIIIDFNDWPSFAPCREEAAEAIARLIVKECS